MVPPPRAGDARPAAAATESLFEALAPALTRGARSLAGCQRSAAEADASDAELRLRGYALGVLARELGADLLGDRFEPEAIRAMLLLARDTLFAESGQQLVFTHLPRLVPGDPPAGVACLAAALALTAGRGDPGRGPVRVESERAPDGGVRLLVDRAEVVVSFDSEDYPEVRRASPLGAHSGLEFPAAWFEDEA